MARELCLLMKSIVFITLLSLGKASIDGISVRKMMEEVEHIMVDNGGTNQDGFVQAIQPCSNFIAPPPPGSGPPGSGGGPPCGGPSTKGPSTTGEQSTAQWIRLAFHDVISADVNAGTGGLDASVAFETAMFENSGRFVNDTLTFFLPRLSAYLGMADLIALGVKMSVATCGDPENNIDLRVGRIDATEGGPAAVPDPSLDIQSTLNTFSKAGFFQAETIKLTVCGHSVGRVHANLFTFIVPQSAITPNNTDGGVAFDSTPDVFDHAVVDEYLNGHGSLGGPLVTSFNESERSDLRLYTSDNNATILKLNTEETFKSECATVFEKMLNTVPSTVTLSDVVAPLTWKAVDIQMDMDLSGTVSLGGLIRNLIPTSSTFSSTVSYTYKWSDGTKVTAKTDSQSGSGTSLYGQTAYYPFNYTLSSKSSSSTSTATLSFGDTSYDITTSIFILPRQSTASNATISLQAAALKSLSSSDPASTSMTAIFYIPIPQPGAGGLTNKIDIKQVEMTTTGTAGDFTLYQASIKANGRTAVIVKVQQDGVGSDTVKTKLFVQL